MVSVGGKKVGVGVKLGGTRLGVAVGSMVAVAGMVSVAVGSVEIGEAMILWVAVAPGLIGVDVGGN